jgi:oligoribonuclease NrnB/cAMP/cGMP phosphodiesterase (DHH superfamily)
MIGDKIIHISHTDLDGYSCQFLFKKFLEKKNNDVLYNAINVDYHEDILEWIVKYEQEFDTLIISDLNIPIEILKEITKMSFDKIIYIDHHLRQDEEIIFDERVREQGKLEYFGSYEKSATLLTYYYLEKLFGEDRELLEFAKLVNIYDLWKIENKESFILSCSLSDAIYYLNSTYNVFDKEYRFKKIIEFFNNVYIFYVHKIFPTIDYYMKKLYGEPLFERAKKISSELELFGIKLDKFPIAINLVDSLYKLNNINFEIIDDKIILLRNSKEILQYGYMNLIDKYNVDIVANVNEHKDGISVSFRSLNGEAIKVAKKFGGGGHSNACGTTLKECSYHDFLNDILYYFEMDCGDK